MFNTLQTTKIFKTSVDDESKYSIWFGVFHCPPLFVEGTWHCVCTVSVTHSLCPSCAPSQPHCSHAHLLMDLPGPSKKPPRWRWWHRYLRGLCYAQIKPGAVPYERQGDAASLHWGGQGFPWPWMVLHIQRISSFSVKRTKMIYCLADNYSLCILNARKCFC